MHHLFKFAPSRVLRPAAAAAFSTLNPSDKSASITLSGGNLTATCGAFSAQSVRGTLSQTSGKYYLEWTIVNHVNAGGGTPRMKVGIATAAHTLTALLGEADALSAGFCVNDSGGAGKIFVNTGGAGTVGSLTGAVAGDIVGMAVDVPNHLIWFHINGTYVRGNPATGTLGVNYVTTNAVFPCFQGRATNDQVTLNVGASAFAHSAPSGFSAHG